MKIVPAIHKNVQVKPTIQYRLLLVVHSTVNGRQMIPNFIKLVEHVLCMAIRYSRTLYELTSDIDGIHIFIHIITIKFRDVHSTAVAVVPRSGLCHCQYTDGLWLIGVGGLYLDCVTIVGNLCQTSSG